MLEEKIQRINELYRKSKAEGLTEAELKEQKILRAEYIEAFKKRTRKQIEKIVFVDEKGNETPIKRKQR